MSEIDTKQQELYNTIPEIVEAAFHSIFYKIQQGLGVETGDEAAYWFSGSQLEQCQNVAITEFREYCKHEIHMAKQYAEEAAAEEASAAEQKAPMEPEVTISQFMAEAHAMPEPELPTEPAELPDINDPYKRSKQQQADVLKSVIQHMSMDPITANVVHAGGWEPSLCAASGALYWSNPAYEFVIYATPLYDDPAGIPVQAQWPDGRIFDMLTVHFNDITLAGYIDRVRTSMPDWVAKAEVYDKLNREGESRWLIITDRDNRIESVDVFPERERAFEVFSHGWQTEIGDHMDPDHRKDALAGAVRSKSWCIGEVTVHIEEIFV